MIENIKKEKSIFKTLIFILSKSWWKLLLFQLIYSFISTTNTWLGTQFFIAIVFGWIIGRIIGKTIADYDIPITGFLAYLSAYIIASFLLYLHFTFYTSLIFFKPILFPWDIVSSLKIISSNGFEISTGFLAGRYMSFKGLGIYYIWLSEVLGYLGALFFAIKIYRR